MSALDDLLVIQDHDLAIDRLRARREVLAERQQLAEREVEVGELQGQLDELAGARDEAVREEKRLDDNVKALEDRMVEVEHTLYGGTVTSPRELQSLQAELEQFKRQRRSLEDQELDVMERREGLDGEVAQLEEKLGGARQAVVSLREAIAAQEGEIDAGLAATRSARERLVPAVPEDLLGLYEQIRERNRGIGIARLVGGTCQACHLALPAVEVDRIKREPLDALIRCDQCSAILVRS